MISLKEGLFLLYNRLNRVVLVKHVHHIDREIAHVSANHEGKVTEAVLFVELKSLELSLGPPVVVNSC